MRLPSTEEQKPLTGVQAVFSDLLKLNVLKGHNFQLSKDSAFLLALSLQLLPWEGSRACHWSMRQLCEKALVLGDKREGLGVVSL